MVVFLIISISLPLVINVMEDNKETSAASALEHEFGRFYDAASVVHYSGIDSTRTITLNVPEGCGISIGGDGVDAYSLRGTYEEKEVAVRYMEQPRIMLVFGEILTEGKHTLEIRSLVIDGKAAVEVVRI